MYESRQPCISRRSMVIHSMPAKLPPLLHQEPETLGLLCLLGEFALRNSAHDRTFAGAKRGSPDAND